MLEHMSLKELCHWIAYHRIEAREDNIEKPESGINTSETQSQKDAALLSRLLELSGSKKE